MSHGQDDGRQRDEGDVRDASDDEQELCGRSAVIVEVVDRDDTGAPRRNEEDIERQNHLSKQKRSVIL